MTLNEFTSKQCAHSEISAIVGVARISATGALAVSLSGCIRVLKGVWKNVSFSISRPRKMFRVFFRLKWNGSFGAYIRVTAASKTRKLGEFV